MSREQYEDQLYREVAEDSPGKLIHTEVMDNVVVEEYMHLGGVIRSCTRVTTDPSQTITSYRKATLEDYAK